MEYLRMDNYSERFATLEVVTIVGSCFPSDIRLGLTIYGLISHLTFSGQNAPKSLNRSGPLLASRPPLRI